MGDFIDFVRMIALLVMAIVHGTDKKFAYDFCNTQMIEYLLEKTSVPIEVEGTSLAVYHPDGLVQWEIEPRLEHLFSIRKRMPDYLFAG